MDNFHFLVGIGFFIFVSIAVVLSNSYFLLIISLGAIGITIYLWNLERNNQQELLEGNTK